MGVSRTDKELRVAIRGDLSPGADLYPGWQRLILQAVVWTLDTSYGFDLPVLFTDEQGIPLASLLHEKLTGPVIRESADQVLAPVQVDLTDGATMSSPATISGEANAFEANVGWELLPARAPGSLGPEAQPIKSGFTTARECCTLSPYDFTLEAPPGDYTLVVHDTDPSGGEGNGVTSVERRITLR